MNLQGRELGGGEWWYVDWHCPLVVTGEHSVAGAEPAASLGLRALGENRRARSTQIFPYPEWTVYASGRHVSKEARLHSVWVHL